MLENRKVQAGNRVRHYKGTWYEVIGYALHTELDEQLVLYKQIDINGNIWAKPLARFIEKAPTEGNLTGQKYLFMTEKELGIKFKQQDGVDEVPINCLSNNNEYAKTQCPKCKSSKVIFCPKDNFVYRRETCTAIEYIIDNIPIFYCIDCGYQYLSKQEWRNLTTLASRDILATDHKNDYFLLAKSEKLVLPNCWGKKGILLKTKSVQSLPKQSNGNKSIANVKLELVDNPGDYLSNNLCPRCQAKLFYMPDGKIKFKRNNGSEVYEIKNIASGYCSKCNRHYILKQQFELLGELVKCKLIQADRVNNLSMLLEKEVAKQYKTKMSDYTVKVEKLITRKYSIQQNLDFVNKVQVIQVSTKKRNYQSSGIDHQSSDRNCWSCWRYQEKRRCNLGKKNINVPEGCEDFIRFVPIKIYRGGGTSPR